MVSQPWVARPWNPYMLKHLLDHDRCMLLADMGLGKTSVAELAAAGLKLAGEDGKWLVIGPLRVARDVWTDEAAKWSQLDDFKVQPIIGTADERSKALRNDKADLYAINYDNIPWLVDKLGAGNWPFPNVIADEARRLKGHRLKQGGVRTQALASIVDQTRRWWNLTGRPAPNGLTDLWGQTWFIDQGFRLGRSFEAFQNRWFGFQRAQDAVHSHQTHVQRIAFPHANAEIRAALAGIALTVDPKDWFDVREPVMRRVVVHLDTKARKHYREMEREMFTALDGHDIEAFAAAAKSMKCLQLANGAAYVNGSNEEWVVVHDRKIEALASIANESDSPILVAYHFKSDLARLMKAFPDAADLATKAGMERFKAGEADIGFGHPASMGHGVDGLQTHCHTAVFMGHWWDLDQRDQFIGRIGPTRQHQGGFDRQVLVYDIVAEDTVDELVLDRHESKRSVQEILLEALKRRQHA